MDTDRNIDTSDYNLEELLTLAGASYVSITNAIDNGEVAVNDEQTPH